MSKATARQPGKKCSPKELAFAYAYVARRFDGAAAARDAGYAPKNSNVIASELLTRPHVQAKVAELTEKFLTELAVTGADVIRELTKLGFSDLRNFLTWDAQGHVTLKSSEELGELTSCIQQLEISDITVEGVPVGQKYKIRLAPKEKPLELLGKHLRLWMDSVRLNPPPGGSVTVQAGSADEIDLSHMSEEDLRAFLALREKYGSGNKSTVQTAAGDAKRADAGDAAGAAVSDTD